MSVILFTREGIALPPIPIFVQSIKSPSSTKFTLPITTPFGVRKCFEGLEYFVGCNNVQARPRAAEHHGNIIQHAIRLEVNESKALSYILLLCEQFHIGVEKIPLGDVDILANDLKGYTKKIEYKNT